eukprot:6952892-Prorocentrum_lima.AAC.1
MHMQGSRGRAHMYLLNSHGPNEAEPRPTSVKSYGVGHKTRQGAGKPTQPGEGSQRHRRETKPVKAGCPTPLGQQTRTRMR